MGDSLRGSPLSEPAGRHFPPLRVAAQRPLTARARGGREWRSRLRGPRMAAAGGRRQPRGKPSGMAAASTATGPREPAGPSRSRGQRRERPVAAGRLWRPGAPLPASARPRLRDGERRGEVCCRAGRRCAWPAPGCFVALFMYLFILFYFPGGEQGGRGRKRSGGFPQGSGTACSLKRGRRRRKATTQRWLFSRVSFGLVLVRGKAGRASCLLCAGSAAQELTGRSTSGETSMRELS